MLPIAVGVAIVLGFSATLLFLYQRSKPAPESFETLTPQVRDIVQRSIATGSIEPREEVALKSRVGGIIDELMVEPGDEVKKGDVIARVRILPDMVRLNTAEAELDAARIRYSAAKREYERFLKLEGVVSDTEITNQRLEFELAGQQLLAAKNNVALVREGAVKNSTKRNDLVTSTVDGMVLDVPVRLGSTVIESNQFNAGTTIASVADMSDLIFLGYVDETEVGKLRTGMALTIEIGALSDTVFEGTLEYIAPKGVIKDGTTQFELRAAIAKKEGVFVRAGFSANASIVLDKREQVLAIDEAALQFDKQQVFVEVKEDSQRYVRRPIEVGLSDGRYIEVVEGLQESDQVKKPKS